MKYRLKSRELTSILINIIVVKMLFTYPRYIVDRCLNGAWLSVIIYLIVTLGIFWLTQHLYLKTGKISILSQAEVIGGKVFRIITGLFVITLLMLNIAPMVRAFPEAIKTALLQNTSMLVIVAILTLGVAFGASTGIEALGRTASVFIPIAGIFIALFFVLLFPHYETTNLFPFSIKDVAIRGASSMSVFADIFVLSLLLQYTDNINTVKKSGFTALCVGGVAGILIVLAYCLVYPYPVSARFIVPMYQLTRLVKIGTYFQRLEAIFEFVWSISILIYTSIYLFIMCDAFKQSFGLRHHKPFVFPLLIILLRLVFWEESYTEALRSNYVNSAVIYPILYILPLLYGILCVAKTKRGEKR